MTALILLARTFLSRATRIAAKPLVAGGLGGAVGTMADDIPGLGFLGGGNGESRRRRRRRKMFTDTDIAQFAAAEAIAGKKAAQALMMIRAAKA